MACRLLPASKEKAQLGAVLGVSSNLRFFHTTGWGSNHLLPEKRGLYTEEEVAEGTRVCAVDVNFAAAQSRRCEPIVGPVVPRQRWVAQCCHPFRLHPWGQSRTEAPGRKTYALHTYCQAPSPPSKPRSPLKSPGLYGS